MTGRPASVEVADTVEDSIAWARNAVRLIDMLLDRAGSMIEVDFVLVRHNFLLAQLDKRSGNDLHSIMGRETVAPTGQKPMPDITTVCAT